MARLEVKTRRNTSQQGKPRVWICVHPEECGALLQSVSDEILEKQNCAVYYDAEPLAEYDAEALYDDLLRMNLFVMPVTEKLLSTPNRAIDVEFFFAIEHHIPVLPIMWEDKLVERFNEKCGELQFLSRHGTDATAISYGEKLKQYLESVLIGDELLKKVRDAFDAYIFLSYRKKDRRYAQQLMHLIHKNDFCRDVAIWYDEFLTPGENFNDSIAEALIKSQLFAMAVTPNLVNEENYVMTVEYPAAVKAKKAILPVEMVHTDAEAFKNSYNDIPNTTPASDSRALSDALKNALESIALRENDADPRHNFFIGLAYLGGIDVEVDHKRALELIESSAEARLPEAMEKLVSMYRMGEGVPRDYERASAWQERLVAFLKSECVKEMTEERCIAYLLAAERLGMQYQELDKHPEARALYGDMIEFFRKMRHSKEFAKLKGASFMYYLELGGIAAEKGEFDEAERIFRNAKKSLKTQFFKIVPTAYYGLYGKYCSYMGDLQLKRKDPKGARYYYKHSLNMAKLLNKLYDVSETRSSLATAYSRLANAKKLLGENAEASELYRKSAAVSARNSEGHSEVDPRETQAHNEGQLGDIASGEKRWDEAEAHYLLSVKLREELFKETGGASYREDMATAYARLGQNENSRGEYARAHEYYLKCLSLREVLEKEIGTAETVRRVASMYQQLGEINIKLGALQRANEYYSSALNAANTAVKRASRKTDYYGILSSVYLGLAGLKDKETDGAKERKCYYEKAAELLEVLVYKMNDMQYRGNLAFAYSKLASIAKNADDEENAMALSLKAVELREAIVKENGTYENRAKLARSYYQLGGAYYSLTRRQDALKCFNKSAALREELYKEIGDTAIGIALSESLVRAGNADRYLGSADKAKKAYLRAIEICEEIAENNRTEKLLNDLDYAYDALAMISVENGWYDFVKPYLFKQGETSYELFLLTDRRDYLLGTALAYERLARLAEKHGDTAVAQYKEKSDQMREMWREIGIKQELSMICKSIEAAERAPSEARPEMLKEAYESCEYLVNKHAEHSQHAVFVRLFNKLTALLETE